MLAREKNITEKALTDVSRLVLNSFAARMYIRAYEVGSGADPDNPIGGGTNFSSSGMYFGWTNEGAKRPRIEGEA